MPEKNPINIWSNCLDVIKENIMPSAYTTWFKPIKPVDFQDNTLTIEVPSQYFVEFLEEQYIDLLGKTLRKIIGPKAQLKYKAKIAQNTTVNYSAQKLSNTNNTTNSAIVSSYNNASLNSNLSKFYTFNNFIEGECNKLGRSAGKSIANAPGDTAYNPLFLHGGPGLGKTHLSQAIGADIKEKYPNKRVLYVSANTFQIQYMDAVTLRNKLTDFLHFYQSIDVLIIDDIHEFAAKQGTQNAFFQIFNHLHRSGKQLILTSDRPPVELKGLEDRLLSRFKWGLTAELFKPEYETRLAIIKAKCERDGLELPDDVIRYLAKNIDSNVRELEGTIVSLVANSTIRKIPITVNLVREVMESIVGSQKSDLSISAVKKAVSSYFGITADKLLANTRKREIVQARQIAMYLCRNLISTSLDSIGKEMGGKNHATVLYACNTVGDLMETDRTFHTYVRDLEKLLSNN